MIGELSRRQFLKTASAGVAGTTLGAMGFGGAEQALAQTVRPYKLAKTTETRNTCPYCSVACGVLMYSTGDGSANLPKSVMHIEGDPDHPVNRGTLCPKGAAIFQLHVNPNRPTQVLHRAPGAADWEVWDLERAMARVAELTKKTRDETFIERLGNGAQVNCTTSIFSLGGATLDNEWNHIQQKLMRGLGIVPIENQARI